MKKYLFTLMMAVLTIACSSVIVSCGNDADEIPTPAPEQGKKGIHRIEATFSGDIENWLGTSQYVGYVTDKTFSDLTYKSAGLVAYGEIYDENTGLTYPTAIMRDPINVVITTKEECERLKLTFSCYYKKIYDDDADKSSILTVTFKGYVNGKQTKSYSKTFVAGQYGAVIFNSVEHSTDGEVIVENKQNLRLDERV